MYLSPVGIGAVIFHTLLEGKDKPVAYASGKLTVAEQNYAQIQKEANVFEVQKFRQYLMGHNFQLNDNNFSSQQRHPRNDSKSLAVMGNHSIIL